MDIGKLDPNSLGLLGTMVSAVGDLLQGVAAELQIRQDKEEQQQTKARDEKLAKLENEVSGLKEEIAP